MTKASLLRHAARAALATATLVLVSGWEIAAAQTPPQPAQRLELPGQPTVFHGIMAPDLAHSQPDWIEPVTAPADAPNVLLIMTDDAGFASSSAFGGPVPTPNLERLAEHGLTYTQFHTAAVCSPSRASLLTGRNPHAVGMGNLADIPTGYPGYDGVIPRSSATIGRVLRDNGYSTAWFGKHHNYAPWRSTAGPFDQWPTGLGFDYFYGFVSGDMNQWNPRLYRGVSLVDVNMPEGQTLDYLLADDALHWIHTQQAAAPDRPFFIYYATGTPHAPHQAPMDWIDRFRGQFDQGWDRLRQQIFARQQAQGILPRGTRLTPRPDQIPAWDSLSPGVQRAYSRSMETFAGTLGYQDAQIGRIVDELQRMGELDNTLIIFIEGDNGASGEHRDGTINELSNAQEGGQLLVDDTSRMGGPQTYQTYPVGWAWALNTPFQWNKQIASHLGGTRNGMVISWPRGIQREGGLRRQFSHLNDIMPTILDTVGVAAPTMVDGVAQQAFDGVSLTYSFEQPNAPERHRTQYFEVGGSRAIYHDGWMASTTPRRMGWEVSSVDAPPGEYVWELYNLRNDFSQARNLAAAEPERLAEMRQLFDEEATRNHVFPIDDRAYARRGAEGSRHYADGRTRFTYWSGDISVMQDSAPMLSRRPFEITAHVSLPSGNANGVLLATGSTFGGWSFYLQDGRPVE